LLIRLLLAKRGNDFEVQIKKGTGAAPLPGRGPLGRLRADQNGRADGSEGVELLRERER
jgi:hypothetical protein